MNRRQQLAGLALPLLLVGAWIVGGIVYGLHRAGMPNAAFIGFIVGVGASLAAYDLFTTKD